MATGSLKQTGDSLKGVNFQQRMRRGFFGCISPAELCGSPKCGLKEHSYTMETIWLFLTVLFAHSFKQFSYGQKEYLYLISSFRRRKSFIP